MSMKMKAVILTFSAGLLLFTVAGRLNVRASSNNDGAYRQIQVYSEVLSRVRSEYVEEPNTTAVTDGALHGLLDSLDSDSSYLTPDQYKEYKSQNADVQRWDRGRSVQAFRLCHRRLHYSGKSGGESGAASFGHFGSNRK